MAHYVDVHPELAVELINTFDLADGHEHLKNGADLAAFAAEHGISVRGAPSRREIERVRDLRSRMRQALLTDDEEQAVAGLNSVLAASSPSPQMVKTGSGWALRYHDSAAGVADQLVAAAAGQLLDEIQRYGLSRVSTCSSTTCDDVFIDQSRNHSRRFCSPTVCGNRESQRAFRARQADASE